MTRARSVFTALSCLASEPASHLDPLVTVVAACAPAAALPTGLPEPLGGLPLPPKATTVSTTRPTTTTASTAIGTRCPRTHDTGGSRLSPASAITLFVPLWSGSGRPGGPPARPGSRHPPAGPGPPAGSAHRQGERLRGRAVVVLRRDRQGVGAGGPRGPRQGRGPVAVVVVGQAPDGAAVRDVRHRVAGGGEHERERRPVNRRRRRGTGDGGRLVHGQGERLGSRPARVGGRERQLVHA